MSVPTPLSLFLPAIAALPWLFPAVSGSAEPARQAEAAIRAALGKPVSLDCDRMPLATVVDYLADTSHVPVKLDRRALDDVGTEPDVPISFRVDDVTLRSALHLMLRELDLTCMIHDEVLLITTPEEGETQCRARVYSVGDLVFAGGSTDPSMADFDSMIELLTSIVQPTSWGTAGGPGAMSPLPVGNAAVLVAFQTDAVDEEVCSLLAAIRAALEQTADGGPAEAIRFRYLWPEPPGNAKVREALAHEVPPGLAATPLVEFVASLRAMTGVNVLVDTKALSATPLGENVTVSHPSQKAEVPLALALRQTLNRGRLTYVLRDEVVLITTPEEAETQLSYGVYPVADLAEWVEHHGRKCFDMDALIDLVASSVERKSWDTVGGFGSISPYCNDDAAFLVVRQTDAIHEKLAAFLAALRAKAAESAGGKTSEPILLHGGRFEKNPAVDAIRTALDKKADFEFIENPIMDVVDYIQQTFGIECQITVRAIEQVAPTWMTAVPVTCRLRGVTLRSALDLILRDLDLEYVIGDDVLLVTTEEELGKYLTIGIYPVADLVSFRDASGEIWADFDPLVDALTSNVRFAFGESGPGEICPGTFGEARVLVIRATDREHEAVARLLADLRAAARDAGGDGSPPRRDRPRYISPPASGGFEQGGKGMY